MTISRILLAANDSPAALGAGRLCVALAAAYGASIRAITVQDDDAGGPRPAGPPPGVPDPGRPADPVLHHIGRLASAAQVAYEGVRRSGAVAPAILAEAGAWGADLIVIGRSDQRRPGQPYIGHHTRHVLEFADTPVLVVPYRAAARTG